MDILAARKKAEERAREREKSDAAPIASATLMAQKAVETPAAVEQQAAPAAPPPTEPAGKQALSAEPEPAAAPPDPVSEWSQAEEIEMLSFRLGEEEYAVPVDDVKEVLKNRELTPVPNAPDYILGVTSLRGPILPVIDLCKRLGMPSGLRDEKSRILVVTLGEEDAGILVDRVSGVVRINPDAVRSVPETIERGAEFLRGISRKDDKLYILLDIEKAFSA
jgi:purine-binding chemotaxis protein CheW